MKKQKGESGAEEDDGQVTLFGRIGGAGSNNRN